MCKKPFLWILMHLCLKDAYKDLQHNHLINFLSKCLLYGKGKTQGMYVVVIEGYVHDI